ncbi:MAG: CapA family protein [Actinomycetota bacterium]|nr:CapA family protein [Actinomycetota bacterium]
MSRTLNNKLRKIRARRQALFLVTGCIMIALVIGLVFAFTPTSSPREEEPVRTYSYQPYASSHGEAEALEEPAVLSLGIGGDVCLGLEVADLVQGEDSGYLWTEVSDLFDGYDLVAVNLESPLCRYSEPHEDQLSVHIRGDDDCASPMAEAGVDAVCLANDHIMDFGSQGLEETLNALRSEEIGSYGAGPSASMASKPLIEEGDNGASVALLAFCDVAPASYAAGEDSPGLAAASSEEMASAVDDAGMEADYVAVILHWGDMGSNVVTDRQRELAHTCVEAGADLVAGCHPHVIQGLEVWQGVPIIYSLGNLVYYSQGEEGKSGLFAGCYFEDGSLASLELIPMRIEGAKPAQASGDEAQLILQEMAALCPEADVEISSDSDKAYLYLGR